MTLVPEVFLPIQTQEPLRRSVAAGVRLAKAAGSYLVSQETAVLNARDSVLQSSRQELGKVGGYVLEHAEADNRHVGASAEVMDEADSYGRKLDAIERADIDEYHPAVVLELAKQAREFASQAS